MSARTRSRGSSLPRPACRARAASPPPSSISRTLVLRSATSAASAARLATKFGSRVSRRVSIAGMADSIASGGRRMARHQLVRMRPAGLAADTRKPVANVRVLTPVHPALLGEEQVAAQREIGDRQALADDIIATLEVLVQDAPCGFRPPAKYFQHGGVGILGEGAHEAIGRRITRELVVVPQQPAQNL